MKPFGNLQDRNKPIQKNPQTPPTWRGDANVMSSSPLFQPTLPEDVRPTWRVGTNSYYITLEQIVKRHIIQIKGLVELESSQTPGSYSQYLADVLGWLYGMNQGLLFIMTHTQDGVNRIWSEIRQNNNVTAFVTRMTQDFYLSDLFDDEGSMNRFITRMNLSISSITQSKSVKETDTRTFEDLSNTDLDNLYRANPWFLVVVLMNGMNLAGISLS